MRMTSAFSVIGAAEPATYENGLLILLERKDSTANATHIVASTIRGLAASRRLALVGHIRRARGDEQWA